VQYFSITLLAIAEIRIVLKFRTDWQAQMSGLAKTGA